MASTSEAMSTLIKLHRASLAKGVSIIGSGPEIIHPNCVSLRIGFCLPNRI